VAVELKEQTIFQNNTVVNLWFDADRGLTSMRQSHLAGLKGEVSAEPIELCS
jgi:hypothetical protein